MSQHDYDIANQTASNARVDINLALKALASQSSGSSAPTTTYANMVWYDTGTNTLKMRSEADDAWITLGVLDQSANTFTPAGITNLTQVQAEDDTSTVFGQVSGERLGQALSVNLDALATGGAGAPRILGRALAGPDDVPTITVSAADTVVKEFGDAIGMGYVSGTGTTSSTSYVVAATYTVSQAYTGAMRFYATQTASGSGGSSSTTSSMYLRKNGVTVSSVFTVTGFEFSASADRSVDVAISEGDVFEWLHKSSSFYRNCFVGGVKIGASDLYVPAIPLIKASENPL